MEKRTDSFKIENYDGTTRSRTCHSFGILKNERGEREQPYSLYDIDLVNLCCLENLCMYVCAFHHKLS